MLEQLMGLIKDNSQEAIVNNPAIPNEHNESAMQTILSSVVGGLANQGQTNQSGLFGLLSGKAGGNISSNPIVSGMANTAISSIMSKFGLDKSAAGGIVSAVLPSVIGSLINKTNDPNDSSFDLSSIMGAVMGGGQQQQQSGDGMMDVLGSVLGGGNQQAPQQGGGLMDMVGGLLGGNQQQQPQKQQGGGLMDMLNVFLKSQQK
jgi:hypothetical protein